MKAIRLPSIRVAVLLILFSFFFSFLVYPLTHRSRNEGYETFKMDHNAPSSEGKSFEKILTWEIPWAKSLYILPKQEKIVVNTESGFQVYTFGRHMLYEIPGLWWEQEELPQYGYENLSMPRSIMKGAVCSGEIPQETDLWPRRSNKAAWVSLENETYLLSHSGYTVRRFPDFMKREMIFAKLPKCENQWIHRFGFLPQLPRVVDWDQDGEKEMLFTTISRMNGCSGEGTTDSERGYLLIMDRFGAVELLKVYYGRFLIVTPYSVDLNGDGKSELLVAVFSDYYPGDGVLLEVLDEKGKVLKSQRFSEQVQWPYPIDLDGDGKEEIVAGSSDGTAKIISSELRVVKEAKLPIEVMDQDEVKVTPFHYADLDGDRQEELFFLVRWTRIPMKEPIYATREIVSEGVWITSSNLDFERYIEASPPIDGKANFWLVDLNGDQGLELALYSKGKVEVYGFR